MQLSACLMAVLLVVVVLFSKSTSFIWANGYHTAWLDVFFTWYTNLGDGVVAIVMAVALFFFKKRAVAIKLFLAFLVSGLAAQLLKDLLHAPRPATYFNHQVYLHFIEGVTHGGNSSFPSGHTTTAFAVATTLACCYRQKWTCLVFFVLAAGVAYSRVYLGQHFVEDVLAGMVLGIATAVIIEYLYYIIPLKRINNGYSQAIQHEQPAIEL